MGYVYVFFADGFEEIEAITPIDLMRRSGIKVATVGITGKTVRGAHGIVVETDIDGKDFSLPEDALMVVLPGGSEGTANLRSSSVVKNTLLAADKYNAYIAAICAAPTVLHAYGLLQGKRVTSFPDVQDQLTGCFVTGAPVEVDGRIITGRSAGVALRFGYVLCSMITGQKKADEVYKTLYPEI